MQPVRIQTSYKHYENSWNPHRNHTIAYRTYTIRCTNHRHLFRNIWHVKISKTYMITLWIKLSFTDSKSTHTLYQCIQQSYDFIRTSYIDRYIVSCIERSNISKHSSYNYTQPSHPHKHKSNYISCGHYMSICMARFEMSMACVLI